MTATLAALAALFAQLSLLAFGGGNTVLPEMQRAVLARGWMDAAQFAALFALAQAAPGPNLMIAALVGWQVADWPGAVVAMLCIVGPSSLLTAATATVWERFRQARWRRAMQAGLVPVTVGMVVAAALVLAVTADTGWRLGAVTVIVAVVTVRTKLHPLWLLGAGAALGAAGVLGGD